MGELINSIITHTESKNELKAKPKLIKDEYGLYYFEKLPENTQLIKEEDYQNLNEILSVGKYYILESATSGEFELHKVKPNDIVFKLSKYIPTKQLFLYLP